MKILYYYYVEKTQHYVPSTQITLKYNGSLTVGNEDKSSLWEWEKLNKIFLKLSSNALESYQANEEFKRQDLEGYRKTEFSVTSKATFFLKVLVPRCLGAKQGFTMFPYLKKKRN
jgi:hypothetical protein